MTRKLSELTPLEIKGNVAKPTLIVARPDITVRQALEILNTNNITSLPIYSHDSENIVNIVNLVDVLNYVIKDAVTDKKLPIHLECEKSRQLDNPIEVVMTLDNDRESYRITRIDVNDKLKVTLQAFSGGVHRSLVVDYSNQIEPYILTQTDIIRYVYAHPESLPSINFDSSLKSLGLVEGKHEIVIGHDHEIALNVYRRMSEKSLTGIPIVNNKEQLVGNLSVSDLRKLDYESINKLTSPVLEFLEILPNPTINLNPISATEHTSLRETLKLIVENHIHRVWIIHEDRKVQGSVSLTDLIKFFL